MSAVELRVGDKTFTAVIAADRSVTIDGERFEIHAVTSGVYRVTRNGRSWTVGVAGPTSERWLFVDGLVANIDVVSPESNARGGEHRAGTRRSASEDLASPMPATVVRLLVEPGAQVTAGATLLMLEAMKMELPIRAPRDGVVRAFHCKPGDLVQPGAPLLDLV